MNALHPYIMFRVERIHYVPMEGSLYNDYTPPIYNVQGRTTTLYLYIMFRVE